MFKKLARKAALKAANLYINKGLRFDFLLNLFTEKDPKLTLIFDRVFILALKKGFQIKKPEVRKVFGGFRGQFKLKRGQVIEDYHIIAEAISRKNIILVFGGAIKGKEEDELLSSVMLAHELGHIVDYQTKRNGHPLFDNIRHEDGEMFADAFAAYLFSKFAVVKMRTIFVSSRFNQVRFSQLNLKC